MKGKIESREDPRSASEDYSSREEDDGEDYGGDDLAWIGVDRWLDELQLAAPDAFLYSIGEGNCALLGTHLGSTLEMVIVTS